MKLSNLSAYKSNQCQLSPSICLLLITKQTVPKLTKT